MRKNNSLQNIMVICITIGFCVGSISPVLSSEQVINQSNKMFSQSLENNGGLYASESNESPDISWVRTFGGEGFDNRDFGESVCLAHDGGYIIACMTKTYGAGKCDLWVIKTDDDGNEQWNRTFGGAADDIGKMIQRTDDEGYIIVGWTDSFAMGGHDLWIIKLNVDGMEEWNYTYGGLYYEMGHSINQTMDGGYIISGITTSFGLGGIWLIKTFPNGTEQWNKTYGGESWMNHVQQTADGGYIVIGAISSTEHRMDPWFIKTDANGNIEWDKIFRGIPNYNEYGQIVRQTNDGGYIIGGWTTSYGKGGYDFWLIKTDTYGNETWNTTFGGWHDDYLNDLQITADGGYILIGYTYSYGYGSCDIWVIKTDSNGHMAWDLFLGGGDRSGADYGNEIQLTPDNGYILVGTTDSDLSGATANYDVILMKLVPHTNQPPEIQDIPSQIILKGENFIEIYLDKYGDDFEDPDSFLNWSFTGNVELDVSILNRVAKITPPSPEWIGSETITFTVQDTDGLTASDEAVFTVTSLEITNFIGENRRITATIINHGDTNISGFLWNIQLNGGIIPFKRRNTNGTIDLPAGQGRTISSSALLGFGFPIITISGELPGSTVTLCKDILVFLFLIKLRILDDNIQGGMV